MVWVWVWVCLICVYLCGCLLCKHIIIIYGVRYKNAFFTCMATKLQFAYIFILLAIFPLLLFYGVVYNAKMFFVESRCV